MPFPYLGEQHRPAVTSRRGMVASANPLASMAGARMLLQGGNAVDAAVATAAALNVAEPYMSGIGGVGYMVIYHRRSDTLTVLDYNGRAPAAAELARFTSPEQKQVGPMSPLVPGACGGWLAALERYGTMDRASVFAPAIELAEGGVALTRFNVAFYEMNRPRLERFPASVKVYLPHGRALRAGDIIVNPDLANTFRQVVEGGAEVFYRGPIGRRIAEFLQANGGLLAEEDLAAFEVAWQEPISTTYRGYTVYCPPPPCSGIQYLITLNLLEGFDMAGLGHNSAEYLHTFLEAAKLASADRAAYAPLAQDGPDGPPVRALLSQEYAARRRAEIDPNRARYGTGERYHSQRRPDEVVEGDAALLLRESTTHFDAIDAEGNCVSVTQTLGGGFGSAVVVEGTGIALNNFAYWFDLDPESPNAIAPRKRVEQCLSPAQIWRDGRPFAVIGTPGSFGIMQTTPQMMLNLLDHGFSIQAAIEAARCKATEGLNVDIERRVPAEARAGLEARGHVLNVLPDYSALVGGGQGIMIDPDTGALTGGADPRRDGYAIGI